MFRLIMSLALAVGLVCIGAAQASHGGGHKGGGKGAHKGSPKANHKGSRPLARNGRKSNGRGPRSTASRHPRRKPGTNSVSTHRPRIRTERFSDMHRVRNVPNRFRNWHLTHGVKFAHGYFYRGRYQPHWSYRTWHPRYHTWCYWCPATSAFYYWCGPHGCYYPVSYCPTGSYDYDNGIVYANATDTDEVMDDDGQAEGTEDVAAETGPEPAGTDVRVRVNVSR